MTTIDATPGHETVGTDALRRFGWRDGLLWAVSFVVVFAAQVVGVYALSTWQSTPELPGAPPPAVMIELAEIAVAPQVEDIAADAGELTVAQQPTEAAEAVPMETIPEEQPLTAEAVTEPVEPETAQVAEAVLPETLPEPIETAEPTPIEPEEIEPVEAVEPIDELVPDLIDSEIAEVYLPTPIARPSTLDEKRQEFAETQQVEKKVPEKPKEKPKKKPAEPKEQAAASKVTAPKSVEAETSEKVAASASTSTTKRTSSVSPQKWTSIVQAKVVRSKRYPAAAKRRREEGIAVVKLLVDRGGRLISAHIARSSGFSELDKEAVATATRAAPFPTPPASITQDPIPLLVNINFNLKT